MVLGKENSYSQHAVDHRSVSSSDPGHHTSSGEPFNDASHQSASSLVLYHQSVAIEPVSVDSAELDAVAVDAVDFESETAEFFDFHGWNGGHAYANENASHQTAGDPSNASQDASQSESPEGVPVAFMPRTKPWQMTVSPVAAVGGVAVSALAGLSYVESTQPQFEGSILLASQHATVDASTERVTLVDTSSAIAPPDSLSQPSFSPSAHHRHLETAILPQVVADLQAQGISIEPATILKNLELQPLDAGIVEISYQAKQAEDVSEVLEAIARTYQLSAEQCQTQACVQADYTETQIRHTEQKLMQLRSELNAFQDQHPITNVTQQIRELDTKRAHFSRVQQALDRELSMAQAQLAEYSAELGLEPSYQNAQVLLSRSPRYQATLSEWQQLDRQLVNEILTPLDDPTRTALTRDYEHLSGRLYADIHRMLQDMRFYEFDPEFWRAILENPQRIDRIEPWLNQAQLVQFLSIRREHLATVGQHLDAQTQEWRSLMAQHQRITTNLHRTAQTLAEYEKRYASIQQQSGPEQVDWEMIAPLEVLQIAHPLTSLKEAIAQHVIRPAHAL